MKNSIFVIRNQLDQYWTRSGEWVDGREPQRAMKLKHQDEAINLVVELSAKDISLRATTLELQPGEGGELTLEASPHQTPTLAERAARIKAQEAADRQDNEDTADRAEPAATAEV